MSDRPTALPLGHHEKVASWATLLLMMNAMQYLCALSSSIAKCSMSAPRNSQVGLFWYYSKYHIICKIQFIQCMLNPITISRYTIHFRQNAVECLHMNSIVTLLQRLLCVDKVRLKIVDIWRVEHMHCWMNTIIEMPPVDALDHYPICSLRCRIRKQTKPTKRSTLKPMQLAESCPPCLEAL